MKKRLEDLRGVLKVDQKKLRIGEIQKEMNSPDFWLEEKKSTTILKELKKLETEVKEFDDLNEIAQIADETELEGLKAEIEELETRALFSGKYDDHNAILSFFAGAGGDDAQDWNEMLMKMYVKWAEQNNATASILEQSRGGEAGVKSATIEITGMNIFGKLKGESGVHRLVRQSPFNAKSLRQTSFALVEVMPDIENDNELEINQADLRIDTFRASGKGGQGVNTTDSAVRITHIPTGITASCQNERSQLQNRETAMKVLRSRLAQLMLDQHKDKVDEIRGDYSSPEWGNQIRSYVLHPYKLVKDHRTNFESTEPDKVLNGDLNAFIKEDIIYLNSNKST